MTRTATHVYHWKHGWIPLDHTAAGEHHGSKAQESHIRTRRDLAKAITTLPKVKGTTARSAAGRQTAVAAHRIGAVDALPQALRRHDTHAHAALAAEAAVAAAHKREPRVTAEMHDLAASTGGTLEGLEHRLKDTESATRKIESDVHLKGVTVSQAASELFDLNRYTIAMHHDDYAAGAQLALDQLRAKGFDVKVKNFWTRTDNPYQGINAQVTDHSGAQYELQLNTPESLAVKNGALHKLYEEYRVEKDHERADALTARMHEVASTIPVPPGIHAVS